MKTAVDSSVLLDVFGADPTFGEVSRRALRRAFDKGALVACDVVWAEVRAHFPSDTAVGRAMDILGVEFEPLSREAALSAGALWRSRRRGGGARPSSGRDRVVDDVLVGAHARHHADVLLTRDRGFYRIHFRDLRIIDPSL